MRALLFASAAVLALTACDNQADIAGGDAPSPGDPGAEEATPQPVDLAEIEPEPEPEEPRVFPGSPDAAEQRPPNADLVGIQEPAFDGQTRAPVPSETEAWRVEEVTGGLVRPWALEFLPDGDILLTERGGNFRIVTADGEVGDPLDGAPDVWAQGQGGLLDVALAPDFESSGRIFYTYSEPRDDATGTALATATLSADRTAIEGHEVLFQAEPGVASPGHFGSRIVIDGDHLFVTLGDRMLAEVRVTAQTPEDHIGTVVRLNLDGSIPDDNPYADGADGRPEVWSYGHRNIQAADLDPVTGLLWTVEHGARGGDELNRPEPGVNYGWPILTYGLDYPGTPIGEFETDRPGMEQPVYYWDPVVAPGGMSFYTGDLFPNWTNDLFIAGQSSQRVSRVVFNADRTLVEAEEWLPIGERVREVKTGPDGALYLITDEDEARLLRIVPG